MFKNQHSGINYLKKSEQSAVHVYFHFRSDQRFKTPVSQISVGRAVKRTFPCVAALKLLLLLLLTFNFELVAASFERKISPLKVPVVAVKFDLFS